MRKILILGFMLFFLFGLLLSIKSNSTYSYLDCYKKEFKLKEITTLSLNKYINENKYELISFCSFDMCYTKKEDTINESISNFKKMFDKYLSEDDYNELNIKGYPITSITIYDC